MNQLNALSLSIALLAAFATFLAVGPAGGLFLIWAATIPWAAYFLLGANEEALKKMIICGIFGVFMAWLGALQITNIAPDATLGFPFMASIAVFATVLIMCLAAKIPQLACIPASVLGYSATFAYLLQTNLLNKATLFNFSFTNPLLLISVSIVIGTFLGQYSAQLAAKFTKK